jgi:hypothetical protein
VGVVFSASNLQGADHFEKPALQFGNAYAEKRKAALAAQVARRQQDEWQDGLEKARREEEQLGEKCRELLPVLQSPALEAVGDVPAFSLGELLILLTDRKHPAFKQGPNHVLLGSEPKGFYFTKEFLRQEGFCDTDIAELYSAARQMIPSELLTAVMGKVEGQQQVDYVETRGFEVTVLGENIARKFKEITPSLQS